MVLATNSLKFLVIISLTCCWPVKSRFLRCRLDMHLLFWIIQPFAVFRGMYKRLNSTGRALPNHSLSVLAYNWIWWTSSKCTITLCGIRKQSKSRKWQTSSPSWVYLRKRNPTGCGRVHISTSYSRMIITFPSCIIASRCVFVIFMFSCFFFHASNASYQT